MTLTLLEMSKLAIEGREENTLTDEQKEILEYYATDSELFKAMKWENIEGGGTMGEDGKIIWK